MEAVVDPCVILAGDLQILGVVFLAFVRTVGALHPLGTGDMKCRHIRLNLVQISLRFGYLLSALFAVRDRSLRLPGFVFPPFRIGVM